MSGLEFVASLASSLAWPVAILLVALVFRRQLAALLAALLARPFTSVKAGPVELVWDREIAEAEAELGPTHPPGPGAPEGARASDQLAEVARIAPAAAVMQAFARIERQLHQVLTDAGAGHVRGGALQLARQALDLGLVQQETVRAIEGTAVLRNLVAHGRDAELDQARALDYLALTDAISYALSQQRPPRRAGGQEPTPPQGHPM